MRALSSRQPAVLPRAHLGKRASGWIFAIGFQAVLALLLLLSLTYRPPHAPERETVLTLLPARVEPAPLVIDARGPPRPRSPAPVLRVVPSENAATAPAPVVPSLPEAARQALQALPGCAPDKLNALSPEERARCRTLTDAGPPPRKDDVMASPYQPRNQAQWDAEMEKRKNPLPVIPPRIGISDPLCKLAVLLAGMGGCGPPPAVARTSTDAQFKAALDAYHQRRGGGPPSALASPGKTGVPNAQMPDAAAGPAAGGPAGPGR